MARKNRGQTAFPGEAALRAQAAERAAARLDLSARLIGRAEDLAAAPENDCVGALNAAARLMAADSQMLSQLVRVAQVETRHRSFVERVEAFPPGDPRLNPKNYHPPQESEDVRRNLIEKLNRGLRADLERADAFAARCAPWFGPLEILPPRAENQDEYVC